MNRTVNRSTSIKDIGNIYIGMQQKALQSVNESVVEEAAKVKATPPKGTFPLAKETVKEPSTFKKGGPKNVKNLKKAKKNKKFSQKTKKITKESINNDMSIFYKLYEDVMKSDELDINTGIGMGPEGGMGDVEDVVDIESDVDTDETPESPKEMLQQAIDLLQKAVDAMGDEGEGESEDSDLEDLGVEDSDESDDEDEEYGFGMKVREARPKGEGEDEDEESEDEDEEHEDEDEDLKKEGIDMQKLPDSVGHKLTKAGTVGNIKATSGKADSKVTDEVGTETGKHPMDHKSELSNPSKNKVGSLKAGKSLFDQ